MGINGSAQTPAAQNRLVTLSRLQLALLRGTEALAHRAFGLASDYCLLCRVLHIYVVQGALHLVRTIPVDHRSSCDSNHPCIITMRLILDSLVTLGLCATVYASQEQVVLDGRLDGNEAKRVAIVG